MASRLTAPKGAPTAEEATAAKDAVQALRDYENGPRHHGAVLPRRPNHRYLHARQEARQRNLGDRLDGGVVSAVIVARSGP